MAHPKDANRRKPGVQTIQQTKKLPFALQLGFFAGLIWGGVRWLFYYFGFTDVVPGFLVEPFFLHDFLAGTAGYFVGYASFIAMSMIASVLYTFVAYKLKGPWPGVAFGIVWYALIYLLIGPLLGMLPPVGVNDWDSLWFDGALFVLWGVFIGYTVNYEFTDERERGQGKSLVNLQ
ncbi:YqhR family membrane protein [Paenibacillus sp.]|uniref:YqhR family membrane protein n=1 Tax=Paenibacillus sp. TaxID=58172 RepID=UPI002D711597|nr:YqhR family membrane protein [Paenibacillus sp.]HZG85105.1 YqhR family membrane protein [Paenibacillus sp.]